jgi:hypothetical protein
MAEGMPFDAVVAPGQRHTDDDSCGRGGVAGYAMESGGGRKDGGDDG